MQETKVCKGCKEEKVLEQYHIQKSNRDGRKSNCKQCSRQRYAPVEDVRIECRTCKVVKPCIEFTVHHTYKTGRSPVCIGCRAEEARLKRRADRAIYHPASGQVHAKTEYITRVCNICAVTFEPIRKKQIECPDCSKLCRRINSNLTSSRGKNKSRKKVSYGTVRDVAKRYHQALRCVYCAREFSPQIHKSLDHVVPLCLGSSPNDQTNVVVACIDCNRSKQWLSIDNWISLCKMIVANYDNIAGLFLKPLDKDPDP